MKPSSMPKTSKTSCSKRSPTFTAIEERCVALLGLHAALASKHLATVSRRLAAVASIFLPFSFLVGFWDRTSTSSPAATGWPTTLR